MAKTKVSDIIVPSVFNPYVVQRTMELSALYNCGIVANNNDLDALAKSGGKTINMPFWEDLSGDDELLSDSTALTPAKITASQDVAALLMRGKAWGANDLAKALSGSDPMAAIGDLVAGYWARRMQYTLIQTLTGAFGGTNMSNKKYDISTVKGIEGRIAGETYLDALQKMGDAKDRITGLVMHSAVETQLRKNNLISTYLDSDNKPVKYFMEQRVIVDDGCPVKDVYFKTSDTALDGAKTYYTESSGTYTEVSSPNVANIGTYYEKGKAYTTYLFGQGAIGLGNGAAPVPTETDRDSLAGDDILITRNHFILHPRGVKWIGTPVGESPSNAELAAAANWARAYEEKAIRMVSFTHRL